jgi:hypothetical protein
MSCAHRYRYPEPDGPTSVGVCAYCGAQREDRNVINVEYGETFKLSGPRRGQREYLPRDYAAWIAGSNEWQA